MSMGVERAEARPHGGMVDEGPDGATQDTEFAPETAWEPAADEKAPPRESGRLWLAALLGLVALLWVGASGWAMSRWSAALSAPVLLSWVATVSVPLILLGMVWLLFGRARRRETELYVATLAAMRAESAALEQSLTMVAARLADNRAALDSEAGRLMALGEEASDRLGRVTHFLARETADLDRKAAALEGAAANARVDIGVLLADLPRAEADARAVAEAMKQAGLAAHEQAGGLEGQLAALSARGREADETLGGAAQRLAAHLARIESQAGDAAERIEGAAATLDATVDGALARASEAVEATRAGIDAQGGALLAMIEESRAGFASAGAEASRDLAERLDTIAARLDTLSASLAAQDESSARLLVRLGDDLAALDRDFTTLGATGADTGARLDQSLAATRAAVRHLESELDGGKAQAGALIDRAHDIAGALDAVLGRLREDVPAALAAAEDQAARTGAAADSLLPSVEAVQAAAALAWESLDQSEASLVRQRVAADAFVATLSEGLDGAERQLGQLGALIAETDDAAARIVATSGQELIDALVRVREAANQAALHAREAIIAAIPQAMDEFVEAGRDAVNDALTEPVRDQIAQVALVSENATAAARKASERLTRQLLAIGETAAAIEARIDAARSEQDGRDSAQFSRRVGLLVESLNSTAIDVTKILSNEVTDSAWAAYLKGDRGVFTRRAVRLLDSGEAREIARHYEEEPEFRAQVNRYIHDFELMLQRVTADRDGDPIAITLLSSDMGKLYVALAQAIERLRR